MPKFTDICHMYIVVAAATKQEIQPFIHLLEHNQISLKNHQVEILLTGVGILASAHSLTVTAISKKPDLIIQAGMAGSFSSAFPPGSIVIVKEELIGDCGVREDGQWKDTFDLNFEGIDNVPFKNKKLVNPLINSWNSLQLPTATGLTVNQVSTDPYSIQLLQEKYHCDIETMEGASLHFVCLKMGIPFIQIRSISNKVGSRNKKEWTIQEAISSLNNKLAKIIQHLP